MMRSVWDELDDMNRQLSSLFPVRRLVRPSSTALATEFTPGGEVYTQNGDLVVRLEIPGIDPSKDVKVTLENGELVIRGERRQETETKDKTYYRRETYYGSFERHFPLPDKVDEKSIQASYKDGILEVVAKGAARPAEAEKPKQIPVMSGQASPSAGSKESQPAQMKESQPAAAKS